jgi:hypothetical protein
MHKQSVVTYARPFGDTEVDDETKAGLSCPATWIRFGRTGGQMGTNEPGQRQLFVRTLRTQRDGRVRKGTPVEIAGSRDSHLFRLLRCQSIIVVIN